MHPSTNPEGLFHRIAEAESKRLITELRQVIPVPLRILYPNVRWRNYPLSEVYTALVTEVLQLSDSIMPQALIALVSEVTVPENPWVYTMYVDLVTATDLYRTGKPDQLQTILAHLLTQSDEQKIRKHALNQYGNVPSEYSPAKLLRRFNTQLMQAAQLDWDRNSPFMDPSEYLLDPTKLEHAKLQQPYLEPLPGGYGYSIRVGEGIEESDCIVVTNKEANARLSNIVLGEPQLLQNFLALYVHLVQHNLLKDLDQVQQNIYEVWHKGYDLVAEHHRLSAIAHFCELLTQKLLVRESADESLATPVDAPHLELVVQLPKVDADDVSQPQCTFAVSLLHDNNALQPHGTLLRLEIVEHSHNPKIVGKLLYMTADEAMQTVLLSNKLNAGWQEYEELSDDFRTAPQELKLIVQALGLTIPSHPLNNIDRNQRALELTYISQHTSELRNAKTPEEFLKLCRLAQGGMPAGGSVLIKPSETRE